MTPAIDYRSYEIVKQNDVFIGRTAEGEDPSLVSNHVARVKAAIDQLWDGLENDNAPEWFALWMKSPTAHIDLDEEAAAGRMSEARVISPVALRSTRGKVYAFMSGFMASGFASESAPSSVDPPAGAVRAALLTLAVAMPLSFLMHQMIFSFEPAIVFSLGVVAVSLSFGSRSGLLLTLLSAFAYNVSAIVPVWTFTPPTAAEFLYAAMNIAISLIAPAAMRLRKVGGCKRTCSPMVCLA